MNVTMIGEMLFAYWVMENTANSIIHEIFFSIQNYNVDKLVQKKNVNSWKKIAMMLISYGQIAYEIRKPNLLFLNTSNTRK